MVRPRGHALIVEHYDPKLTGRLLHYEGGKKECTWWVFGYECLRQMLEDAGFERVETVGRFKIGGRGQKPWMWHAALRAS